MMNRGVMQRQMFRNGGAASFPDLSGDGRISQKDILMGRGVQGLANGGPPMDPGMMPPPPGMMPPPPMDPGMMPPPPMAPPMAPPGAEQALMGAEAQGQQAGMMAMDGIMQNIDGAEDYAGLINGLRGNDMPLEARYAELASLVGPEDAERTPESVLTLTQPAIMMTEEGAMNSGIGELMQGIAGDVNMEGPMEEGVGSLMMAQADPPMDPSMMEVGNTPPVNFRHGGPVEVRGYAGNGKKPTGEVKDGGGSAIELAQEDLSQYQDYLSGGYDAQARAADLQEQREMSQAQMLFDIAGAAADFAGNTEGGSIAERLANSVSRTQLTDKIGARAANMLTAKQAQTAEKRQLDMAARTTSLSNAQNTMAARRALALEKAKTKPLKTDFVDYYTVDASGIPVFLNSFDRSTEAGRLSIKTAQTNQKALPVGAVEGLLAAQAAAAKLRAEEGVTGAETKFYDFGTDATVKIGNTSRSFKAGEGAYLSNKELEEAKNQGAQVIPFDLDATYQTVYHTDNKQVKIVKTSGVAGANLLALLTGKSGNWGLDPTGYQNAIQVAGQIEVEGVKSKNRVAAASRLASVNINLQSNDFINEMLITDQKFENTTERDEALNEYAVALQEDRQVFDTAKTSTLQDHKVALAADLAETNRAMQNLENLQGRGKERLKATLKDRSYKLNAAIDLADQKTLLVEQEERLVVRNTAEEIRQQALDLEIIGVEQKGKVALQTYGNRFIAGQNAIKATYVETIDNKKLKLANQEAQRKASEDAFSRVMQTAQFTVAKAKETYDRTQDTLAQSNVLIEQAYEKRRVAVSEGKFEEAKKAQTEIIRINNLMSAQRDRLYELAVTKGNLDERAQNELETHRLDLLINDGLRLKQTIAYQNSTVAVDEALLKLKQQQPDIRVIGDFVMDFNTKNNPGSGVPVVNTATGNPLRSRGTTTTNINGTIIDTTDPENPKIVYQDPSSKYEVVNGQFMDMSGEIPVSVMTIPKQGVFKEFDGKLYDVSDPQKIREIAASTALPKPDMYDIQYDDGTVMPIDANTINGQSAMKAATENGYKVTRIGTTKTMTGQGFISKAGVITSYDGISFVDPKTGKKRLLTAVDAVPVSAEQTASLNKAQRRTDKYLGQLVEQDNALVQVLMDRGDFTVEGKTLTVEQARTATAQVRNAFEQARRGTGFWSNIAAGLDSVLGGPLASPKFSQMLFGNITDARQFTQVIEILGRSALRLDEGRPAMEEKRDLGKLFPNAKTLVSSPVTEARKLVALGAVLVQERRALLEKLSNKESSMSNSQIATYESKLYEVTRLQELLGPVIGNGIDPGSATALQGSDAVSPPVAGTETARERINREALEAARARKAQKK